MPSDFLNEITAFNFRCGRPKPGKCALLVIDMQQFFLSIASPILQNVRTIIDACRSKGVPIIFTRHGHRNILEDGGMLAKWWGDCIEHGSNEWKIMDAIVPKDDDRIVDKNRYSAFFKTRLDEILKSLKIEELIITGVMTNCCCETTARDGFVRDYRIFFISDATAAANEELHLASLKNLAYGFAHILNTETLCRF
jgi:isochorismate hydrolase